MVILYEIASKKIISPFKAILIHELYRQGYSQRRIASLLMISQPQVYKYLSRSVEDYYGQLRGIGIDIDRIKYYVSLIINTLKKEDIRKFILLINSVAHTLAMDYVCKRYSEFRDMCREGRLTDPSIEYYREWVEKLVSTYDLIRLIPEVGSNIVYAPEKPNDPTDIIGLTGRIVRVGSTVRIVGEPMYGGSKHLSQVLLIAVKYHNMRRAAMNIAYVNKEFIDRLSKRYRVVYNGPHESHEVFWRNLENVLVEKPDIVVDLGGYGLEPVIYILANDLDDLEDMIKYMVR